MLEKLLHFALNTLLHFPSIITFCGVTQLLESFCFCTLLQISFASCFCINFQHVQKELVIFFSVFMGSGLLGAKGLFVHFK